MDNKLKVELANGNYLVAEVYGDGNGFPKEIATHIEDKNGIILQDICSARQHYDIAKNTNNTYDVVTTEDIDCIIWADSDDEDYTDKFVICQHKFEEDEAMGEFNAKQVLENLEKLIQDGQTVFINDVYKDLSIFAWWSEKLPPYRLMEMKQFLKEAIKLGFTGYVCFKVGASGCANGMWAHKNESVNGYATDGDCLYRSFTPDYTYWSVTINGKWYPEAYGLAYDSCKTVNDIEKLINRICGGNINE